MTPAYFPVEAAVRESADFPRIALVLPFEPKMEARDELHNEVEMVVNGLVRQVINRCGEEHSQTVVSKLKNIVAQLDFSTHKKGIAIFVSPEIAEIYYLETAVEKWISIDSVPAFRELVSAKNQVRSYLLVEVKHYRCRIFLGEELSARCMVINFPENSGRDLDQFFSYVDNNLRLILESYSLPLVIIGEQKLIDRFRKCTRNGNYISFYIPDSAEVPASPEAQRIFLRLILARWNQLKQADLLLRLRRKEQEGKLSVGIKQVLKAVSEKRGSLLMVERGYVFEDPFILPVVEGAVPEQKYKPPFFRNDLVDEVVALSLKNGARVELLDEGALNQYQHIVLFC